MLEIFYNNVVFHSLVHSLGHKNALLLANCFIVSCVEVVLFVLIARKQFFTALYRSGIAILQSIACLLLLYGVNQIGLYALIFNKYMLLYEYTFVYVFALLFFLIRQYRMLKQ